MEKVYLMDNHGRETEAYKVRYINYNNNNYFIYTMDETDSEGYTKLYLKKIVENEEDELDIAEWEMIKSAIPTIVKEIKANNIKSFKDLNMKNMNEIMQGDAKVFKLKSSIVESITFVESEEDVDKLDIIEEEKPVRQSSISMVEEIKEEEPVIEEAKVSFEEYEAKIADMNMELDKYKEFCINLKKQNDMLKQEVSTYSNKLSRLKEIMKDI